MKDLGITKGEWRLHSITTNGMQWNEVCWSDDGECITDHVYTTEDAELICDAGNTAQKCGLLPSELLRQRDELIERNQMLSKTLTKLNVMVDINTGNKNQ